MPYALSFKKAVTITDRDQYINECCVGGDVIVDQLFPTVQGHTGYTKIHSNQEDWGWFIWFRKGDVHLAIDIHTDDPDRGEFRVRLTSSVKRFLWRYDEVDTPELDELRDLVIANLEDWIETAIELTCE
jgi:hypothetical protein